MSAKVIDTKHRRSPLKVHGGLELPLVTNENTRVKVTNYEHATTDILSRINADNEEQQSDDVSLASAKRLRGLYAWPVPCI